MNQLPIIIVKHFSEVFKMEQIKIGSQTKFLIKVEIGETYFDCDTIEINTKIKINKVPLFDLQNKYLVGVWLGNVSTFRITGFQGEALQD